MTSSPGIVARPNISVAAAMMMTSTPKSSGPKIRAANENCTRLPRVCAAVIPPSHRVCRAARRLDCGKSRWSRAAAPFFKAIYSVSVSPPAAAIPERGIGDTLLYHN